MVTYCLYGNLLFAALTGHRIYLLKIKCKGGGSYFYKNQKYRRLEIDFFFFSNFISEIPNFPIRVFSENAQSFAGIFL